MSLLINVLCGICCKRTFYTAKPNSLVSSWQRRNQKGADVFSDVLPSPKMLSYHFTKSVSICLLVTPCSTWNLGMNVTYVLSTSDSMSLVRACYSFKSTWWNSGQRSQSKQTQKWKCLSLMNTKKSQGIHSSYPGSQTADRDNYNVW